MKKYSMMTFPKRKFFPPRIKNLKCVPEVFTMIYYYLGKLGIKKARNMMNLPFLIPLEGSLDIGRLEDCIRHLFEDEPIFRTYMSKENGNFYLVERDEFSFDLKVRDVEGRNRVEKLESVKEILKEEADKDLRFFDPNAQQTRFELLKVDDNYHVLLFVGSHIYFDFGAVTSVIRRLINYYNGDEEPGKRFATFGEFIEEETAILKTPQGMEELKYWDELMKDYKKVLLPKEKKTSHLWKPEDSIIYFDNDRLEAIAKKGKTSVFNNSLLAIQMAYAKYTQSYDSAATYIISNRSDEKYRHSAGMLMRMLLNRIIIDKDITITELQRLQRRQMGEGYLNRHVASDLSSATPLMVVDESMSDISGELIFNGKPIDLQADINMDSLKTIFPTGLILVQIMPDGDRTSFNIIGNLKYYGRHYRYLRDNIALAVQFMERYPDKTFGEFMKSDITLDNVDFIEDPKQVELIVI